jgi:hypothetical protein
MNYSYISLSPQYNSNVTKLSSQPLQFPYQLYPRVPYYYKENMPCGNGCGAVSTCNENGICVRNKDNGTLLGKQVDYTKTAFPLGDKIRIEALKDYKASKNKNKN